MSTSGTKRRRTLAASRRVLRDDPGQCVSCGASGIVGDACAEFVCAQHGYHLVPIECARVETTRSLHVGRSAYIGRVVSDCLVVDEIGYGTFGAVLLALQRPLLMPVAVKLLQLEQLDPELRDELTELAIHEAGNLARLNHPNIVGLKKFGIYRGVPYIAMEFVGNGSDLYELLSVSVHNRVHIGWDALRRIFHQIVSALQCAHEAEIVHHDVKPTNIMIQKVAGDPYFVKLLDFGLAKLYEFRAQSGSFAGTPRYIAPEQIRGSDVGPWTDLYSVATILFELCTGRILNPGDSPDAMLWRRESMDFRLEAGALHDAALVRGLAPFFDRALARDPFDRFHDATAFREAMDRAFDLLTVGMSPETLSQNILAVCDGAPEEAQNPHGPMFETSVRRVPRTFSLRDVGRYGSEARVAVPHAFVDVSSRGQGLVELPATIQPAVAVHDTGLSGTARATGEFRRREAHPIWRAVMIVSGVIATALLVVAIQEHRSTLSPRSFSDADVPAPRGESSDARSFASPPPRVGVRVERPQRSVVHPDEPPNRRDRLTRALVPEQRRGPADEAWRTSRRRERNLELRHTRSPRQTTVYVSTNPAGAELYLGGEYAGLSPKRLTFPGKTANLVVYAKGFATLRLTLSGGRPTLKLNLRQR